MHVIMGKMKKNNTNSPIKGETDGKKLVFCNLTELREVIIKKNIYIKIKKGLF